MLKAKYVGGRDGVQFILDGASHTVAKGESVEVTEEQAVRLLSVEPLWAPGDKDTADWLKELRKVEAERVAAEKDAAEKAAQEAADAAESEG